MEGKTSELVKKLKLLSLTVPDENNSVLISFLSTLDDIVGVHSIRVAGYSAATGRELQLTGETIAHLHTSALLHDIGKLFVPRQILYKADSLNDQEYEIIRRHPTTGYNVLLKIKNYSKYSDVVLHHHEFYNGRGYPEGLSGEDIPLMSRIIALADAYEAMTSERPYRKGFSHREAVTRLKASRSTQFDPDITEAFLRALRKYPSINAINSRITGETDKP